MCGSEPASARVVRDGGARDVARWRLVNTPCTKHPLARLLVCVALAACTRAAPSPAPQQTKRAAEVAPQHAYERHDAARVVAIGDLHGDLAVTRKALRLAGAIDTTDHWVGGRLVVVQTGDVIDRGDEDRAVLDLLDRLRGEATRAGGALIALCGNHEFMNVGADLRYVSAISAAAFAQGRAQAFTPGAPYARLLANWPVIVKLGDSVFVHGGVLLQHVRYGIDRINQETAAWMRGEGLAPGIMLRDDAPIWTRLYSSSPDSEACAQLDQVLGALGAVRMVVGHTPQASGISAACGGKVWRIDTGMSHVFGGRTQLLEIEAGHTRVRDDTN
jgi:Calcineurin-like phosphoesterase